NHLHTYDLVDTHYLFSYAPTCAAAIARYRGIPYTMRTMGQLSPWALAQSRLKKQLYIKLVEQRNLDRAAVVHCTSEGEASDVSQFGIQAPLVTVPLGVDSPPVIPDASAKLHQKYDIPTEASVILFLSRLHYKKRPDLLLQALQHLGKCRPFHCLLAGSGDVDYVRYLQQQITSLGLTQRVTMPGFVEGYDKHLLLQGSDVFVLPSFSENFGIAVAEALQAGLPVVITPDVQIAPEIAKAGAGLVVEGTAEAVAAALEQLLASPDWRCLLGRQGKILAADRYSWKAVAHEQQTIYELILKQSAKQ
ncbi:MAG: glycosyltransferase, partial [Cyanobacteria bacterium]|nr:glycosyltransferase [Cyanobacteriota bacterium]MDW8201829.1 glycosyltransferase [Cyanobacteriota bacterium SKYGB_h_bin112]